jgi:hypothetical protein
VKAASLITPAEVSSYSVHYVAVNHARGRYSAAKLDRAAYIVSVGLGLFPGCEVAAGTVLRIIANVQERLGIAARRRFDVVREHGEHGRRLDPVGDGGRFGVGGERGADRAGDPVGGDPGKKLVRREGRLAGPGLELLDDPRREAGG